MIYNGRYPTSRLRRLRASAPLRRLVCETTLAKDDLILPLFVCPGMGMKREVSSMPGVYQFNIDTLVRECERVVRNGIPACLLFGIPESKDAVGSEAYAESGIVQQAVRAIKQEFPHLLVIMGNARLCEYTSHGHCGILDGETILNDPDLRGPCARGTEPCPSGRGYRRTERHDGRGRVGAYRTILDSHGFQNTPVVSYAAKYASGFYGPFREAAESTPQFGDRRAHQMDPGNSDEALREVAQDIEEGADIVMVKPAMPYLDVLMRVKKTFGMPTAAYQVSGEYAMIKAAARNGWIDEERVMLESLIAIKRAGADMIVTYFAHEAASLVS